MAEENGTLMRKTKQELVNIILRKDDVASKLQDEVDGLREQIKIKANYIDSKEQYISRLKEEVTKLNTAVKSKVELLDSNKLTIQEKNKEIAELNGQINDIKEGCDEYASQLVEMSNKNSRWKAITIVAVTCALIAIVIAVGVCKCV